MLVCLKVGRVAKIDCASAAVKGSSGGKGARPVQLAIREGNGIVGKQHERPWNRPAAYIDCRDSVKQLRRCLAPLVRRSSEQRHTSG